jgi:hypothetical protein
MPEAQGETFPARDETVIKAPLCRHPREGGLPKTFGGAEEERELVVVAVLCYALVRK